MSVLIIDPQIGSDIPVLQVFEEQGFAGINILKSFDQARAFFADKQQAGGIDNVNLVVINSQTDDGDAYEYCRELRKTEYGQRAYIIVLVSSANNTAAIDKALYCGADDFAVRPYDSNEFLRHLMLFVHKRAVLLVEDDATVCQLVRSILLKKQLETVVVDDGLRAYNLINSMSPPKLVLLDIGLPGMSGLKLVKHIRGKPLWRKTPIIMLTASTSASDVKESLDSGANEYIVKPFQIGRFSERISRYFSEHG